jgi:aldehyde:ferredoxin oxidoreductase
LTKTLKKEGVIMEFINVNMTEKSISTSNVPKEYAGLGGRGLTSTMINATVPPTCDPLGPDNKLIFAPGSLSGTNLVNTSRLSIGAKSPLTGGIKESNVGGTISAALGRLGIAAIVIDGKGSGEELYLLKIDKNGKASLEDASAYKGKRTYEATSQLLETYGEKNSVLCIGPAGEFQLTSASIQTSDVDGHPCRAAGRGGLGAVMGAKGIKAIVVDRRGKKTDTIADPEEFKKASKDFVKAVKAHAFSGESLPALGTAGLVGIINSLGAFPSKNATQGVMEGWEKISGETMAELITKRGGKTTHQGCSRCIVNCSNVFVDEQGKFVTSSLEYETIWSMGGMTSIDSLDDIARLDYLCDDIGLDTMNTGVAISVAMDAGHLEFGDGQGAIKLVEEVAKGTKMGKIIGMGPVAVGKHFNHHRVPAVKGQSVAAYDPRAMQGMAATYAKSPMGGDHTAGLVLGEYLAGALNPLEAEGQVEASRNTQIFMAANDCTGLCLLASFALGEPEGIQAFTRIMNAKSGTNITPDDISAMGIQVLKEELEFNRKAGFTNEDDRLPKFYYEEPLPPHNKVVLIPNEELDDIFNF